MQSVEGVRNPKNYLFLVAHNHIVDHIRHSRVISIRAVENLEVLGAVDDEPSPETQASDREQLHRLAAAVSELAKPNRKAFLMRVMDDLSHKEIGDRLGLSDNAVQKIVAKSAPLLLALLGRAETPTPARLMAIVTGKIQIGMRDSGNRTYIITSRITLGDKLK